VRRALWVALVAATAARGQDGGVEPPKACAIDAELSGLKEGGLVWVFLFDDAKAFPTKRDKALKRVDVVPAGGKATVAFEGLTCGREYAVAVVHDENGNGKLDTNFIGIPREGLGSSRDATGVFGPPPFSKAKLVVQQRTPVPITVKY
jgi:uncharacterized protein (DUF2141 family)